MKTHDPRCQVDDQKILDDVDRDGWHVLNVLDRSTSPGWAFSIGFYRTFGHPEVVVFGLNNELNQSVINSIGEDLRSGKTYPIDAPYPELIEGFDCILKHVNTLWYPDFLGYADWFYKGTDYPALQCIWPDKNGRYPWEDSFNPDWKWAQPLLYAEDVESARTSELLKTMEANDSN